MSYAFGVLPASEIDNALGQMADLYSSAVAAVKAMAPNATQQYLAAVLVNVKSHLGPWTDASQSLTSETEGPWIVEGAWVRKELESVLRQAAEGGYGSSQGIVLAALVVGAVVWWANSK